MPLGLINIEEREENRWTAEVEIGGLVARRVVVNGDCFEDIIDKVCAAYREILPLAPGAMTPEQKRLANLEKAGAAAAAKRAAAAARAANADA